MPEGKNQNDDKFQVRVWYDGRDDGQVFGPVRRNTAEELIVALACRETVIKATIERVD